MKNARSYEGIDDIILAMTAIKKGIKQKDKELYKNGMELFAKTSVSKNSNETLKVLSNFQEGIDDFEDDFSEDFSEDDFEEDDFSEDDYEDDEYMYSSTEEDDEEIEIEDDEDDEEVEEEEIEDEEEDEEEIEDEEEDEEVEDMPMEARLRLKNIAKKLSRSGSVKNKVIAKKIGRLER